MTTTNPLTTALHDIAAAFGETAARVSAEARNTVDPVRAAELRRTASRGRQISRVFTDAGDGVANRLTSVTETASAARAEADAKAARMATLVRESRERDGLRDVDPISETAPRGTQYRRIVAGNLLADIGKLGIDRVCAVETGDGYCVLKDGHKPPRYDDNEPLHADAEQASRARRYLIHSDPDKTKRG